jgi:hypothetical protein
VIERATSSVPEWPGRTAAGVSGALATGYEYRNRILVRAFVMGSAGRGGFAPLAGVSLGWSL